MPTDDGTNVIHAWNNYQKAWAEFCVAISETTLDDDIILAAVADATAFAMHMVGLRLAESIPGTVVYAEESGEAVAAIRDLERAAAMN